MWLSCTPHNYPTTKLALNVQLVQEPTRLAIGVKRGQPNNGLIWVKWPVLALWQCVVPAKETAWLIWLASCEKALSVWPTDRWRMQKIDSQTKLVPLWASFCRRILRRWRAEDEISYEYRSVPANSWHLPNTPSTAEGDRGETVKTGSWGVVLHLKVRSAHGTRFSALFRLFCWCQITSAGSDEKLSLWGSCSVLYIWFPVLCSFVKGGNSWHFFLRQLHDKQTFMAEGTLSETLVIFLSAGLPLGLPGNQRHRQTINT